jgi:hypothetical protein
MRRGYAAAKSVLTDLFTRLTTLGQRIQGVRDAADLDTLARLDDASGQIDALASTYNAYISLYDRLNRAAGEFLADQWYVSQDDYDIVMAIQGLPAKVGSLAPSRDQMEQIAGSLQAFGEGAAIAVDTANKVVVYAETTHKVLTAVQMAGGVGALVQTGATILTQETLKLCAKEAAKAAMSWAASAIASAATNYALRWLPLTDEQRHWLQVGLDAYQIFAFYKSARSRVRPDASCFAAGTQVVTGIAADGSLMTQAIEEIEPGDIVLSRDQYDAGDDLDPRAVTRVFRKTTDHLRVLTIRDGDGNVETIRTTDEHPFWVEGRGWTGAGELVPGSILDQPDGSDAVVVTSLREAQPAGVVVFNVEVTGDHTYFVEDGTGTRTAVWVHNQCVGAKFLARNRQGKTSEFDGAREVQFVRYSPQQTQPTRDAFNGKFGNEFRPLDGERAKWLRQISHDENSVQQLRQAGFTPPEINRMKLGYNPNEKWQVHHKHPLEYGGTNDSDNLVLIRVEQHETLTWEQGLLTGGPNVGDSFTLAWPMFDGKIVHANW